MQRNIRKSSEMKHEMILFLTMGPNRNDLELFSEMFNIR